jgi:hypothetical protein
MTVYLHGSSFSVISTPSCEALKSTTMLLVYLLSSEPTHRDASLQYRWARRSFVCWSRAAFIISVVITDILSTRLASSKAIEERRI